jgi:beta-glucosidase
MSDSIQTSTAFPNDFLWGAATAAYQIEGSPTADGKGPSIWDMMCSKEGAIAGGVTGDIACDHYRRMKTDVAMMKSLGLQAYRFSISWARIFPDGTGRVNQAGLDFYSALVDELLAAGIEPFATLYHWDLPLALHHRGGWMNREIASWFADYATTVGAALGDRGSALPARTSHRPALLAHARARSTVLESPLLQRALRSRQTPDRRH